MTETDGPASETAVRHPGSTSADQKCVEPIGKASWRATFKNTAKKLVRDRVSMSAGSLAYHWFMSMFPAVIAILGLLALVHIDAHGVTSLTHATEKALPSGVAGVFSSAVKAATNRESGSVVAVIIGLVVSIWSASAGMSALQQALDVAYEVPVDRKFLARRGSLPPPHGSDPRARWLRGGAGSTWRADRCRDRGPRASPRGHVPRGVDDREMVNKSRRHFWTLFHLLLCGPEQTRTEGAVGKCRRSGTCQGL